TFELLVGKASAAAPSRAPATKATRAAAPRGRRRRGGESALQQKLIDTLKASKGGLSLGDLIKKVGGQRGAVKYHLRALRAQKKVKVKGDRKLARWMAA